MVVLLSLFAPVFEQKFQPPPKFVPDTAECRQFPVFASVFSRGVRQSPVETESLPEENRAHLLGAQGDDRVYGRSVDGLQPLGLVSCDIDPDLLEYLNRLRTDGGRL
jgi:hypothetical protein